MLDTEHTFEWEDLNNLLIDENDIDHLIYVFGIRKGNRIISTVGRHWRINRYYKCNNCNQFLLHFYEMKYYGNEKQKNIQLFPCLIVNMIKSVVYKQTFYIGGHNWFKSQYLIVMVKESNFAYINKPETDLKLLMSHLGLKYFEICRSTVSRAITKIKKNHLWNTNIL